MPELPLDPAQIARAIQIPLAKWPGACAAIAAAVLKRFPIKGARTARGFWHGPTSAKSVFSDRPFSQHSWILLADGRILDPTRFAFESVTPYIYIGRSDHYDEAGDLLRASQPQPPAEAGAPRRAVSPHARKALGQLLNRPGAVAFSEREIAWIANRPVNGLRDPRLIYGTLDKLGFRAWIPVDNWTRIMESKSLLATKGRHGWYVAPARMPDLPASEIAAILAPVFGRFLDAENDPRLLAWMEESGFNVDEYIDAARALKRNAADKTALTLEDDHAHTLAAMASEHLGVGNARSVEAYVMDRGVPIVHLDAALRVLGERVGMSLGWG